MGRGAACLLLVAGCSVNLDYGGTSYACGPETDCPNGMTCQLGRCVAMGATIDGPSGGDAPVADARSSDGATANDGPTAPIDAPPPPPIDAPPPPPIDSPPPPPIDAPPPPACEDGVLHGGHCYVRIDAQVDWETARLDCLSR